MVITDVSSTACAGATTHLSLHPLAVEDALRSHNSPRSKLDFYKSHLYLQILVQHMHPSDEALLSVAADEMTPGLFSTYQEARESRVTRTGEGDVDVEGGMARGDKGGLRGKLFKLPDGVEGVFEPTVMGSRLQGGESVSLAFDGTCTLAYSFSRTSRKRID
jgi:hypothetical protein